MPLHNYAVWKATPKSWEPEQKPDHGHLAFVDGRPLPSGKSAWDAAINVLSKSHDSRLVFWVDRSLSPTHPLIAPLASLPFGPTLCNKSGGPKGIDFLRGGIIKDIDSGLVLQRKEDGENNDILDLVNPILFKAVEQKAEVYLFGELYSDHTGIHDIHMNQGNGGQWKSDNGTWQDGCVIVRFPRKGDVEEHWEGIFLAFAVQTAKTDDRGGPVGENWADYFERLGRGGGGGGGGGGGDGGDGGGDGSDDGEGGGGVAPKVSILAALVNPVGPDGNPTSGDPETVVLVNRSPVQVDLSGWAITNGSAGGSVTLASSVVVGPSGGRVSVKVGQGCPLSNKGGDIVLKDAGGNVVDQVSYTKQQADREGKMLYFQQRD